MNKTELKQFIHKYQVPALLILFMGIAVFLSLAFYAGQSLRLDESQSLWQTSHSPLQLMFIVAQDVHVPLYHQMLHLWQLVFSNDIVAVRMFSLIFFVLNIPAVYLLAKTIFNKKIALYSAFLVSISPFMNWYGNEIRMYSLLALITTLNQYFYIKIIKTNTKYSWLFYILTGILGIFTHYFFGIMLLTQALFFFLRPKVFPKNSFIKLIGSAILIGLAFAPWVLYVIKLGSASGTQPLLVKPKSIDFFNTFSQFIFGFQTDYMNTIILSFWPAVIILGFMALKKTRNYENLVIYLVMAALLPVVGAFFFSILIKPFFLTRYLIVALPALYIIIAWFLSLYKNYTSLILKVGFAFIMVVMLFVQVFSFDTPTKENFKEAASYLTANAKSNDIVIVSSPFTIYPLEYYYTGSAVIDTIPVWGKDKVGTIPPFSQDELKKDATYLTQFHKTAWLILSYNQGYEKDVKDYFDFRYEKLQEITFSPGLKLIQYKLRYDV